VSSTCRPTGKRTGAGIIGAGYARTAEDWPARAGFVGGHTSRALAYRKPRTAWDLDRCCGLKFSAANFPAQKILPKTCGFGRQTGEGEVLSLPRSSSASRSGLLEGPISVSARSGRSSLLSLKQFSNGHAEGARDTNQVTQGWVPTCRFYPT
jgi:hypothetical protein